MKRRLWEFLFVIEKNILFSSVKKGFMLTIPVLLIGTLAVLVNSIVLPLLGDGFVLSTAISDVCVMLYNASIGCVSFYLALAVGYCYAQARDVNNVLLRLMSVLTGLICFVILIGGITSDGGYMGVTGVLPAIVVELMAVTTFLFIIDVYSHHHKDLDMGVDDNIKITTVSILPTLLTILGCLIIQYVAVNLFHIGDLTETLTNFFRMIFSDSTHGLFNGMLFTCFVNLLWMFGIHGGNVMDAISEELLVPLVADPNAIVSKSFLDVFAQIGGSGATICLLLALLIASRSKNTRNIARSSAILILFNINELMVFGLPIIFNPIMMIPFVTVPLVSLVIAYVATLVGFIPVVTEVINWTTPIFYSGYLATGSIAGIVVQLVILICGTLIYLPFVKILDTFQEEKELRLLQALIDDFRANEANGIYEPMLRRTDGTGQLARTIAKQLRMDVEQDKVELFYQPQMNAEDCIIGAEALLRWEYQGQRLYPPFVVALAREEGFLDKLTLQTIQTICNTINDVTEQVGAPLHIAVNVVADQLDDIAFVEEVIAIAYRTATSRYLHLELTEETSLGGFDNISANIRQLQTNGIVVAIDDFGMGQTSIIYLREHSFKYVKIDGSLVKNLLDNPRCTQIITSIIDLGQNLNYQVVAEYVESLAIKQKLMSLGCHVFQGYYYSPALPKEEFLRYSNDHMKL
ncbi:EAL domain-containing protein [Bengtsoniella intestinalis]|uniref:PTS sugar transporter subunit IIC/EAL domain-containing protein n=1 Tax=Bengtsoniella intestinalis TaxID=3073143 RepID=UPI00391F8CA4